MKGEDFVSFPSELIAQIESAADFANQTPEEWAAEAVQRQLKSARWKGVLEHNDAMMRAPGIRESDVPRLIHEHRAERHR